LTSTVFPQVRRIAADVFDVPEDTVDPESSPDTLERWDSVHHLSFVLALEERFGIQFSPDQMDGMRTIARTAAIVEQEIQGAARPLGG